MKDHPGMLYVVGVPIGNPADLSPRGIKTLRSVDFIAVETIEKAKKLLDPLGIEKPLVPYKNHCDIRQRGEKIVERIFNGETCAVISDAGMPCLADPGEDLIVLCSQSGIRTSVIPGPCAAVAALAVSGLATVPFAFEGFLSTGKTRRNEHLQRLAGETRTLVFYEAPQKLVSTLEDLLKALGDRKITLARDLTKDTEEILRTTLSQAVGLFAGGSPKGEYALIIEGAATSA